MGFARTTFGTLALLAMLTGCNTTDALTPQVDVGGGRFPTSKPVTERDLQQMADTPQPSYGGGGENDQPIAQQPLSPPQQQAYPASPQYAGRPGPGAPPTTLDQQAAGIGQPQENEQQPQAPTRTRTPVLAAPATNPQPQPQPAKTATADTGSSVPEGETIRFLPIIGAPLPAVTPLSRQLGAEARSRGITIKSSSDQAAGHVLKGYFSCIGGGGTITVTYVWDVLDSKGARLNRIQGQESFAGSATDPWSAVPPSVMQTIATRTMDSYTRWRAGP